MSLSRALAITTAMSGSRLRGATQEWQSKIKPAFYYNEVTANFRVTSKKLRNGTIKGHLRWQYEFLIPKYPIGTFSIYSCLGEATFSAKPVR